MNSVMSVDDCHQVTPYNVKAAVRAEKEGFDAITTGCLIDPGLDEMRN